MRVLRNKKYKSEKKKLMKGFFKSKLALILVLLVSLPIIGISLFSYLRVIYAKEKIIIKEFTVPTNQSAPYDITSGPDGNLWFTEADGNKIGRITSNGTITEFPLPTSQSSPASITFGPDGNLWFTETAANMIGRITPSGIITEFPIPTSFSAPNSITSGPDGNLWFTESYSDKIGRITPSGTITEFPLPTTNNFPFSITSGSDGNLWFTEHYESKIGRIAPNGVITEFPIPTSGSGAPFSWGITSGPDGNLWFTQTGSNEIGRITTNGTVSEFSISTSNSEPVGISTGSDGNLWFVELVGNKIGRFSPFIQKGPDSDSTLLSPFNNGVTWTVFNGYLDNRDQSSAGCNIGHNPLDHCRNQLFGLDIIPDQQNDKEILAPANGVVDWRGLLPDENCMGVRIKLDNGLNMNVCHFASYNVQEKERVLRGKILGTRSTSHVHLSLDDRNGSGNLCPDLKQEVCRLPVPFSGIYAIEGISFDPDPNGETVVLPYTQCDKKNVNCQFNVDFQQYQDTTGTSTNVAIQ